jgi:hypothetical protein
VKSHLYPPLFALLLVADNTASTAKPIEESTFRSSTLDAGAAAPLAHSRVAGLSESERATLKRAQADNQELRSAKAGDVGEGVLLAVAVVLLVIIIL